MKRIALLTLSLFLAVSGIAYASSKWNGYPAYKIFSGTNEVKSATPAIVIKNNTFIPAGALKAMGFGVTAGKDKVTITPPKPTEQPSVKLDTVSDLMDSVFEIYGHKGDGTYIQGSGFIINNVLITNYHVAGTAKTIEILVDGQKIQKTHADILFSDETIDIMGIKLEGQKSVKYTTKLPEIGDKVYTMGFPQGKFRMTEGEIRFILKTLDGTTISHSAIVDNGASGSIIFNADGFAIGVNAAASRDGKTGFSVPITYVIDEINKLR